MTNVVSNWVAYLVSLLVGFWVSPYVVHQLGDAAYGVWALLGSVVGYMGLLDLGVRSGVQRFVAVLHAQRNDVRASAVVSAGLFIFIGAGVVAVLGGIVLALVIDRVFQVPEELLPQARLALVVASWTLAVSLVTGVFGGIVTALQRFDISSGLAAAASVVRAVAVVMVLGAGGGLVSLAVAQLLVSIAQLMAYIRASRRLYPELALGARVAKGAGLRELVSFSAFSSLIHVSGRILYATDAIVIGAFLPIRMVTYFSIAASLRDYAGQFVSAVAQPVTPRAGALVGQGAMAELTAVVLRTCRYAAVLFLPIAITLLVRGRQFIGLWMGPEYGELSGSVLLVLTIPLLFQGGRHVASAALVGVNAHRYLAPFLVAEAALNLALSLYWVRSIGIVGVALGTTVPSLITTLLAIPVLVNRFLDIRSARFVMEAWLRPLVAMSPFGVATWLIGRYWTAETLAVFVVQVGAALPTAAGGAWLLGLSGPDRQGLAQRLLRIMGRRSR